METLAEELFHWQAFGVAFTVAERYQDDCPIGMHMLQRLAANRFPDNYSFEWTMDDFDNVEQNEPVRWVYGSGNFIDGEVKKGGKGGDGERYWEVLWDVREDEEAPSSDLNGEEILECLNAFAWRNIGAFKLPCVLL